MDAWITGVFVAWALLAMGLHLPFMYIYIQDILPTLDKHGKRAIWALSRGAIQKQVAEYGEICRAEGLSMKRYSYSRLLTTDKRFAASLFVPPLACLVAMAIRSWR